MRALLGFLRFVLRVQGFVIEGAKVLRSEDSVLLRGHRHGNALARCHEHDDELLGGEIKKRKVRWRHMDIFRTRVFLECEVREGRCRKCNGRRLESVPWASPQARHTRTFDQRVSSLVQVSDKSAARRMFDVAWRTVGRIVTRVVRECLPGDLLDDLKAICVDETSYKSGHRYITVVTNLERNLVVWVGEGKSSETLRQFFEVLGPERSKELELVAIDMSEAYRRTVEQCAPQAKIVYDRFHVVKMLLEAVDEVRREECRQIDGKPREALKKTRFALLRNPKHLRPNDLLAIARVQATNRRLTRAYQLRVDFEGLWELTSTEAAASFLKRWTHAALRSRLEPFRKFVGTVRAHLDGILNFFHFLGQTSGMAEGMNNKIKLVIHRAFGFHHVSALMAMIKLCCSGIHFK